MMNNFNPFANFGQQNMGPQINPSQFKTYLPQINENMMNQLIQQARQQGISEEEIQQGLNFINSMR